MGCIFFCFDLCIFSTCFLYLVGEKVVWGRIGEIFKCLSDGELLKVFKEEFFGRYVRS